MLNQIPSLLICGLMWSWLVNPLFVSQLTAVERPIATVVATASPLAADAMVEDWPYFLGPRHNGISHETKLNLAWGAEGPKLLWSLPRGTGYASPAIAQGKLVYQHRLADDNIIECLDPATGARLWQRSLPVAYQDRYGGN
jgi:hypothetical protein